MVHLTGIQIEKISGHSCYEWRSEMRYLFTRLGNQFKGKNIKTKTGLESQRVLGRCGQYEVADQRALGPPKMLRSQGFRSKDL